MCFDRAAVVARDFDIIALAEHVLAEPHQHGRVTLFGRFHLTATQRHSTARISEVHDRAKVHLLTGEIVEQIRFLDAVLDCLLRDMEPPGQVGLRAMQFAQVEKFLQIDVHARSVRLHGFMVPKKALHCRFGPGIHLSFPGVFFFFCFGFLKGFSIAPLGTESIALRAFRNRSRASGPSIISAVPVFIL